MFTSLESPKIEHSSRKKQDMGNCKSFDTKLLKGTLNGSRRTY